MRKCSQKKFLDKNEQSTASGWLQRKIILLEKMCYWEGPVSWTLFQNLAKKRTFRQDSSAEFLLSNNVAQFLVLISKWSGPLELDGNVASNLHPSSSHSNPLWAPRIPLPIEMKNGNEILSDMKASSTVLPPLDIEPFTSGYRRANVLFPMSGRTRMIFWRMEYLPSFTGGCQIFGKPLRKYLSIFGFLSKNSWLVPRCAHTVLEMLIHSRPHTHNTSRTTQTCT